MNLLKRSESYLTLRNFSKFLQSKLYNILKEKRKLLIYMIRFAILKSKSNTLGLADIDGPCLNLGSDHNPSPFFFVSEKGTKEGKELNEMQI